MENKDLNLMDRDDGIQEDGGEYVLLPEGDYNFAVNNFEIGEFPVEARSQPVTKRPSSWKFIATKAKHPFAAACFSTAPLNRGFLLSSDALCKKNMARRNNSERIDRESKIIP